MARYRRRSSYRRMPQKTQWLPARLSKQITYTGGSTQDNLYLGRQVFTNIVDHEAVIERWRGSAFAVQSQTGVGQLVIAAHVVEEKLGDVFDGAGAGVSYPDLWDYEEMSDTPVHLSFACVDQNTTNRWNGRETDSKAKRKINAADQVLWFLSYFPIADSVNKKLTVGINYRCLVKFN